VIRNVILASVVVIAACGSDPKPPPKTAEVPANSSSENRLNGKPADTEAKPAADPTQPVMTQMNGSNDDDKTKPKSGAGSKTGPVSAKECNEALERGLDLMIAGDPRFAGIPPEVMQNLKGSAFKDAMAQHGGQNPCAGKGISRAEYDCEMAASTLDDYKKCDKMPKPKK
jgi:hypothetical protein